MQRDQASKDRGDAKYARMQRVRRALPAAAFEDKIVSTVAANQVTLLAGATGSGKTTQLPQFILDSEVKAGRGGRTRIVCTQPRRIAAIGVARRVAEERAEDLAPSGWKAGKRHAAVGYQVRGDRRADEDTNLVFCTTGVLLRKLQRGLDPSITHVLVDEVHERSVETDFLLAILRQLLPSRPSLRVVLMSATMEADRFAAYLGPRAVLGGSRKAPLKCPVLEVPGFVHPVKEVYLDEVVKEAGITVRREHKPRDEAGAVVADGSSDAIVSAEAWFRTIGQLDAGVVAAAVKMLASGRGPRPPPPSSDRKHPPKMDGPGAVLVFLPGVAEIRAVERQLSSDHSLHVLPLHGQLSGEDQSRVFRSAPGGKTKVVLSTNVAETSITIPDITAVVDAGRVKETAYDPRNRMTRLAERWTSLASQDQRRGRAGRVRPGICVRLYPKSMRAKIDPQPTPEIRRCAVGGLCLQIMLLGLGDPVGFLQQCVDPPSGAVIQQSMSLLRDMGAVHDVESAAASSSKGATEPELTPLGRHVARLPLDPQLAKSLVMGCVLRCAGPVLTVAAALAGRPVFRPPPHRGMDGAAERRAAIDAARKSVAAAGSDHLTLVQVYRKWSACRGWGERRALCEELHLSTDALQTLDDTRGDFAATLADLGFLRRADRGARREHGRFGEDAPALNENSDDPDVVSAALCAGLYPNVAKVVYPDRKYHKLPDGSAVPEPYSPKDARYYTRFDKLAAEGSAARAGAAGAGAASGAGKSTGHASTEGPGRVITYGGVAQERVFPHPASVLFSQGELPSPWVVYFEKAATSKIFLRDATVVRPYALLMFGGDVGVMHQEGLLTVGGDTWAKFDAAPRVGVLVRGLRRALDDVLLRLFDAPGMLAAGSGSLAGPGAAPPVQGPEAVVRAIVLLLRGGGY